jgi:Mor family transcriptional regulator
MNLEMKNADVLDRIFQMIQQLGPALDEKKLAEVKAAVREEFGGERGIYKKSPEDRQRLINEVFRRFNGTNATTLARELGISRPSVYRYLKMASSK